ncbi:MAG: hypothetical protein M3198_16010 [Actinomycetota bacterium]|nr:hypothetical protein [Actinomycetota bacterium]
MSGAERRSEVWEGIRKGAGWVMGVTTVVSAAALVREGPRNALKAAIKAGIRGSEVAAEVTEQVRDVWAEAQLELRSEPARDSE